VKIYGLEKPSQKLINAKNTINCFHRNHKGISKTKKAAILGAGMMGSAAAWPLSGNGYRVNLIGTHLDGEII